MAFKLMEINSVSRYRNKLISSYVTQHHACLLLTRVNNLLTPALTSCNVRDKIFLKNLPYCPESANVCFVCVSEQTASISLFKTE